MVINDLQNGQEVVCRIGRAGRTAAEYGPWTKRKLYVQRHRGRVVIITLADGTWAEYGPEDYSDGCFLVEDYYMQIRGLDA